MEGDTCIISLKTGAVNISIHALRVEGDITLDGYAAQCAISIHALRVEGDWRYHYGYARAPISIHALRVEGDDGGFSATLNLEYFYPRPPGGGRQYWDWVEQLKGKFLSTPSGWRATAERSRATRTASISIHALRVEGDVCPCGFYKVCFISIHALRVEGDATLEHEEFIRQISIHALRVEGDKC